MNQYATAHYLKKMAKSMPYLLPVLVLLYFFSQPASTDIPELSVNQAIQSLLASKQHPLLLQPDFSKHSEALTQLYLMNANQLIWLGEDRPFKNRGDALNILSNAADDGLNPVDYDAERMRGYLQHAESLPQSAVTELASYDVALSIALLHYLHDLHVGRIDPRDLNYPVQFGTKSAIDIVALLALHLQQQSLAELPLALAPKLAQYRQLKQVLADYRKLDLTAVSVELAFEKSLRPGAHDPQLPLLRQRLRNLGELSEADLAGMSESDSLYDPASIAAIQRLQQGQGLKADGIVGKQTVMVLNQPLAEKIALIELAMERLRWLPDLPDGPRIIVNIPAFQLWAFNSAEDQNPLNMKVIVGKAEANQTPMLWEDMKYLEFMPYWNIPKSIMDKEILPKLATDYAYLVAQDIELVERFADNGGEYLDNVVDGLKSGRVRARQRPGKKNPLGRVKFIFPNKADVYLHDTPSKTAFNRDRRDLSHGCVRVADAEKLAEFVLDGQEGWDLQAIREAMTATKTQRVSLKRSIPVLFFYTTAFVDQDNKPRFYPDIYGHDMLLQKVLNKSPGLSYKQPLMRRNATVSG
ncbi:L,D-transpeptidase family protein [Methylomonas montana]|uniref:L,D-transpeptidase family protein n=1 Tax=Methylomonas montana TaxID=3058963 RepID=UPI00265A77C2|nr:L,D-transpeptidase family protein [Methylomonas montana]WKJ89213.1 L,D-transpeptidase family protein [Methylomonas montana]